MKKSHLQWYSVAEPIDSCRLLPGTFYAVFASSLGHTVFGAFCMNFLLQEAGSRTLSIEPSTEVAWGANVNLSSTG